MKTDIRKFFLHGILQEICDAIGIDATSKLCELKGGQSSIYIPRPDFLTKDHWLTQAVGLHKARKIASLFGGNAIHIPSGPASSNARKWGMVIKAMEQGKSIRETTELIGCHASTVKRIRKKVLAFS